MLRFQRHCLSIIKVGACLQNPCQNGLLLVAGNNDQFRVCSFFLDILFFIDKSYCYIIKQQPSLPIAADSGRLVTIAASSSRGV
jgi:hypothetical protein